MKFSRIVLGLSALACPLLVQASSPQQGTISVSAFNPGYLTVKADSVYDQALLNAPTFSRMLTLGLRIDTGLHGHVTGPVIANGRINSYALDEKLANVKSREMAYFTGNIAVNAVADYNRAHPERPLNLTDGTAITEAFYAGRSSGVAEIDDALKKQTSKDQVIIAYRFAEEKLSAASRLAREINARPARLDSSGSLNDSSLQKFYTALFEGVEVSDAIRGVSPLGGEGASALKGLKKTFNSIVIKVRPEASNLEIPSELRSQGLEAASPEALIRVSDLSKLDPVGSLLWHRPATIAGYNTLNYNGLTEGLVPSTMNSQGTIAVTWWKPANHGRSAKIYVKGPDGKPYKMKISLPVSGPLDQNQWGTAAMAWFTNTSEVHTQTAANTIASALGFNVVPTYYKQNVRLYFGDDKFGTPDHEKAFDLARKKASDDTMASQESEGAEGTHHNYAALFADDRVKIDENGRHYLWVPEGAFQARWDIKDQFSAGFYQRSEMNKGFFRDHRALALLQALMSDVDTAPDNTDIMMTRTSENQLQMAYVPTDMGSTFGWALGKEQANLYSWDFINRAASVKDCARPERTIIKLDYHSAHRDPIFDTLSVTDARWLARLVGQLTREQILGAFTAAGYPSPVKELLAEKFMKRRDDLVDYTCATDVVPQHLSTVTSADDERRFTVAGFETYFKDGMIIKAVPGMDPRTIFTYQDPTPGNPFGQLKVSLERQGEATGVNHLSRMLEKIQIMKDAFMIGDFHVQAGVTQLMPQVYFLPNGNDLKNPFLRIDVYRFGVGLRGKRGIEPDQFLVDPVVKVPISYVREVIKVHPVKTQDISAVKAAEFIANPKDLIVSAVKGISDWAVKTMEPGDAIVSNGYVSVGAVFDTRPGYFTFGPGASAGITVTQVHQVAVVKTKENELVANWGFIDDRKLQIEAGLRAALIRLNAFDLRAERERRQDNTYGFAANDPAQFLDLLNNLTVNTPIFRSSQPATRLNREMDRRVGVVALSLFGLKTAAAAQVDLRIIERASDGSIDKALIEKVRQHRKKSFFLGHGSLNNDATLVRVRKVDTKSSSSLSLAFEFKYDKSNATIKDFAKLYSEALTVMPAQLTAFKPDQLYMNPILGRLTFEGSVEFKASALDEIFGHQRSQSEVCTAYYDHLPFAMVHAGTPWTAQEWCNAVFPRDGTWTDSVHFIKDHQVTPADMQDDIAVAFQSTRDFVSRFMDAQKAWAKVHLQDGRAATHQNDAAKAMEALNRFGFGSLLRTRIETLESWVDRGQVVRQGTLSSNLESFADSVGEISVSPQDQRNQPVVDDSMSMTKTLIDAVNFKLRPYMYDMYRLEVFRHGASRVGQHVPETTIDEGGFGPITDEVR